MVKLVGLFFFCFSLLQADLLEEKIRNLVDEERYGVHQKLIASIFQDRESYYHPDGSLRMKQVLQKLKDNGLLRLFYQNPIELTVTFLGKDDPLLLTQLISDSLKGMGYYYYITQEAEFVSDEYRWSVTLSSETAIDPLILSDELNKRGASIQDVHRPAKAVWEYRLALDDYRKLDAITVKPGQKQVLKRPINDYWLRAEEVGESSSLTITSGRGNSWYPLVVLFDSQLNIIQVIKREHKVEEFRFRLPQACRYIKISDQYSINNLKNGIQVRLDLGR